MTLSDCRILVTGTSSGLGKFINKKLKDADSLTRESSELILNEGRHYDIIIHSAFNSAGDIKHSSFKNYLNDNIFLTEKLTKLPHKKFIYISSIDVYPKNLDSVNEENNFLIRDIENYYGFTKLVAEEIVKNNCKDFLILRPSAMLGIDSRENSLTKILKNNVTQLSLSDKSNFNYILHEQVFSFIEKALEKDAQGIFNLCSSSNLFLSEVVNKYAKNNEIKFGNFIYKTPLVQNHKAIAINKDFQKTSLENLESFQDLLKINYPY